MNITIDGTSIEVYEDGQENISGALPRDWTKTPIYKYLTSLSSSSRRTMAHWLDVCACYLLPPEIVANYIAESEKKSTKDIGRQFDWENVRYEHTSSIRARLLARVVHTPEDIAKLLEKSGEKPLTPGTVRTALCALRRVLEEAKKLKLMSAGDYMDAIELEKVKGESDTKGRAPKQDEISALLNVCQNDTKGTRDAAILALLYLCGLRRAELVDLQLDSYNTAERILSVWGKGNKQRKICVSAGGVLALADWLAIRGDAPGPLFFAVSRGGYINTHQRLSRQAIYQIVQTRTAQAGLAHLSPHDMRRAFATHLINAGTPIPTVQALMGHASGATTMLYVKVDDEEKRKAVEKLTVPTRHRVLRTATA